MSNEQKKSTRELANGLLAWTKSEGKKPRSWARIPVGVLRETVAELKASSDADWQEAGEKVRGWEAHSEKLSDLLSRALPFLETAEQILRRACKRYEKGEQNMDMLAASLRGVNELSQLMGEIRKAVSQ